MRRGTTWCYPCSILEQDLSAPQRESQISSDLRSWSPNLKNLLQITVIRLALGLSWPSKALFAQAILEVRLCSAPCQQSYLRILFLTHQECQKVPLKQWEVDEIWHLIHDTAQNLMLSLTLRLPLPISLTDSSSPPLPLEAPMIAKVQNSPHRLLLHHRNSTSCEKLQADTSMSPFVFN